MEVKLRKVRNATQPLDRQGLVQVSVDEIEHLAESLGIGLLAAFLHGVFVGATLPSAWLADLTEIADLARIG